jgi:hypothetical protein
MKTTWDKIEKFFGGLKFAVIIILTLVIAMIVGTFIESYHGADYANRLLYKSPLFILLQFGIFISVALAALLRLPPKKRLYGFYTTHSGIILLIIGSYITYVGGIDGNITIPYNTPARHLVLPEDVLKVTLLDLNKTYELPLPYTHKKTLLNQPIEFIDNLKIGDYFPYAEKKIVWEKSDLPTATGLHSSQYRLTNVFVSEEFILTSHPSANEFQASMQLGPLNLHYLPAPMARCFSQYPEYFIWDEVLSSCSPIKREQSFNNLLGEKELSVIDFQHSKQFFKFLANKSPWPLKSWPVNKNQANLTADLFDQESRYRLFNKKLFTEARHLFLFGMSLAYFHENQWIVAELGPEKNYTLPWMGELSITLLKHHQDLFPKYQPFYVKPAHEGGTLVKGDLKALELSYQKNSFWLRSDKRSTFILDGQRVQFELTKKQEMLPFEFTLSRFKMDTNPGTETPASYESFLKLFTSEGMQEHHVYMNNPLKFHGFTFYQASYFKDENDQYGTVLSVNYDPGRFLKYLGSLVLILGSFWHFYLNRKKRL